MTFVRGSRLAVSLKYQRTLGAVGWNIGATVDLGCRTLGHNAVYRLTVCLCATYADSGGVLEMNLR